MSAKLQISDCVVAAGKSEPGAIIDTHCHYNLPPLVENWRQHWQKAQENGVAKSVIASTNVTSSKKAVEIAESDPNLWALVALHPSEVTEIWRQNKENFNNILNSSLREIEQLLSHEKVLGIGETGLDYFWLDRDSVEFESAVAAQKQAFIAQIELARKNFYRSVGAENNQLVDRNNQPVDRNNQPVNRNNQPNKSWLSLHIRDRQELGLAEGKNLLASGGHNAYAAAYEIMSRYDWRDRPFILHCASGSLEYVAAMVDLGAYVGFDGNLTYPKASHLREIWELVPAQRRLLETDAPYLPPQEFRGQVCEPWMISYLGWHPLVKKEIKSI